MRCSKLIEKLEQMSPLSFAEKWDNTGLLLGRRDKEITRAVLAVDPTDAAVDYCVQGQADILLTHHPLIFKPLNRIVTDHYIGRRVYTLIRNDIVHYALHTNYDIMEMADTAADKLALLNRQVLQVTYEDEIAREGLGRVGKLPRIMTLRECAEYVRECFALKTVRIFGEAEQTVEWAAISPGSGHHALPSALAARVEVLITGDIDHHTGLDGVAQGLTIIDAGHWGLEKIFIPNLQEFFRREMPAIEISTPAEHEPFQIIGKDIL